MKEIVITETIRVTQQPAVELTRLDIQIALSKYVESRGYVVDSLAHFTYEDGFLAGATVNIVK